MQRHRRHLTLHRVLSITHRYLFVDSVKLEQIFVNILSNAVKYTPEGGDICLTITEESCDRVGYSCLRTVIADTGITKKMVDLMGGTIAVESELGKGTRVTIRICHRIASQEEWAAARKEAAPVDTTAVFAGKRVLLAEDGAICVELMMRRPAGYYGAVIMDIQMPSMDGYQATAAVVGSAIPRRRTFPSSP